MSKYFPSFYSDHNNKTFFFLFRTIFTKKYRTQDYCVSTYDSFCFLEKRKFNLILIGTSLIQFFQRSDKYLYIYQHIDCLYTLYKHRVYSSSVTSRREVLNQLKCGVQHNLRCKVNEKRTSVSRKRLVIKKLKKNII